MDTEKTTPQLGNVRLEDSTMLQHWIDDILEGGGEPAQGTYTFEEMVGIRDQHFPVGEYTKEERESALYSLYDSLQSPEATKSPEVIAAHEMAGKLREVLEARIKLWRRKMKWGKGLTPEENTFDIRHIERTKRDVREFKDTIQGDEEIKKHIFILAQAIYDKYCKEQYGGILLDGQMLAVTERLADNVKLGLPTLIVGDMGIAKTAVAKFIGQISNGYEIFSGHASMTSDVLTGRTELRGGDTRFRPGGFVIAITEGKIVVLDEVNVADQAEMMRLQDYLLHRPGEKITVQENGEEEFTVKQGSSVVATANEAGAHYTHRQQLDPAFGNRLDRIKIEYPDVDRFAAGDPIDQEPVSLMRLALRECVTENGEFSPYVDYELLLKYCKLAHMTEYLYSVPARVAKAKTNGLIKSDDTLARYDDESAMATCITPRDVSVFAERFTGGTSAISMPEAIKRAVRQLGNYNDALLATTIAEKRLGIPIGRS